MKQKRGVLITNGFLKSSKFDEIYRLLQNAAKKRGAELSVETSKGLVAQTFSGFPSLGKPDFILFWDKDITLAKLLEKAGFKLFNNARAVEICDSKTLTALELLGKVPMPKTLFSPKTFEKVGYTDTEFVEEAAASLGLPMVIKESFGSFGQQVYLAKTLDEAKEIVKKLAGKDFVMQKFVAESAGRDIRLNVVGGKVVNAILRKSRDDFRSNVTLGGSAEGYAPTAEECRIAESACRIVGADFAGVDVLFGKNGPLLCEVNSNLHFKSTLNATGVNLAENILEHVLNKTQFA